MFSIGLKSIYTPHLHSFIDPKVEATSGALSPHPCQVVWGQWENMQLQWWPMELGPKSTLNGLHDCSLKMI